MINARTSKRRNTQVNTGRTKRWFSGLQARLTVVMITVTILATVSTLGINYWSYRHILLEQGQRAFVTDLQQRAGAASADLASATDRSAPPTAAERIGGDAVLVSGGCGGRSGLDPRRCSG